jgi:hypothetical protein
VAIFFVQVYCTSNCNISSVNSAPSRAQEADENRLYICIYIFFLGGGGGGGVASRCVFTEYSKSEFRQNTTILLSIKLATCFDSVGLMTS